MRVSPLDIASFFVPLVLLLILWKRRSHFWKHKVALTAMLALTFVAISHFYIGMLDHDPYVRFLREIDAPRRFWRYSALALLALSYWGDAQTYLQMRTRPHLPDRGARRNPLMRATRRVGLPRQSDRLGEQIGG